MRILSSAIVLAAASLALPATAADKSANGRASVSYSDLDLGTEAGRAELRKRFDKAAHAMCGADESGELSGRARYCYERTSKQLAQRADAILEEHAVTPAGG
jgi:UrcA family protein